MVLTPTDNNLGGVAQYMMAGMNFAAQGVQRHLGGLGGEERIKDLVNKTDLQLENNAELIRIREDVRSGKLNRDQALDELTIAGYCVTEPIGQSEPITGLRNLGKGTPFQLFGEVSDHSRLEQLHEWMNHGEIPHATLGEVIGEQPHLAELPNLQDILAGLDLPGRPGLGNLPGIDGSNFPNLPNLGELPNLPNFPNVGELPNLGNHSHGI